MILLRMIGVVYFLFCVVYNFLLVVGLSVCIGLLGV